MQQVPLSNVPSQDLSISLDGVYWQIKLSLSMEYVIASISRDGVELISGIRCFAGQPLLPYPYMYEPDFGNLIFDSEVDWADFGGSCTLYYLSAEEFKEFKAIQKKGFEDSAIKTQRLRDAEFAADKIHIPSGFPITPPAITIQPVGSSVAVGAKISIKVTAKNWDTVLWQYTPISPGSAWITLKTENTQADTSAGLANEFIIQAAAISNKGYYRSVLVGDGIAVTSSEVHVEVS